MPLPVLPLIATTLFLALFAFAAWEAQEFHRAARAFPMAVGLAGLVLALLDIVLDLRFSAGEDPEKTPFGHAALHFGLIGGYLLLFVLVGFPLATGLYTFGFLLLMTRGQGRTEWLRAAVLAAAALAIAFALRALVGGRF
jgi:hypothetical protein